MFTKDQYEEIRQTFYDMVDEIYALFDEQEQLPERLVNNGSETGITIQFRKLKKETENEC